MTRIVLLLILAVAAMVGVLAYNRQRGSDAVKEELHSIIQAADFTPDQSTYLAGLLDRYHDEVIAVTLRASGESVGAASYISQMFDHFISSARADGRTDAFLQRLEEVKQETVAANRG